MQLIVGVACVVVAAALYLGWSQMHKSAKTTTASAPIQPPAPDYPLPGASSNDANASSSHSAASDSSQAGNAQSASGDKVDRFSRPSHPAQDHSAGPEHSVAKDHVASASGRPAPSAPLVVKTESQHPQSVGQDAPEAPSISGLGATARSEALNTIAPVTVLLPVIAPQKHNISQGVVTASLLKKVPPVYPTQALQMRIQGTVTLLATIGKNGSIKDVKVVSGPAPLARAAMDAVRQWKYSPSTLNGEPVEAQTEINIKFGSPR